MDTKICTMCGEDKPLNAKNWRKDKNTLDGWQPRCKPCASKNAKSHYRSWKTSDLLDRGRVGVHCLLWSDYCGMCPCKSIMDVSLCWRLEDSGGPEYEDYPVSLPQ